MTTPPPTWPAPPKWHARMTAITAPRCLTRHTTSPACVVIAETPRHHWRHPHLLPFIAAHGGLQSDVPSAAAYPAPRSKGTRADAHRPSAGDAACHPDSPSSNRHRR